jgi:hypothetical protein
MMILYKNKIKLWLPYIVICVMFLFILHQCNQDPELVEVPVEIEVPIPVVEVEFDTIKEPVYIPYERQVIDSSYYDKYLTLRDSIAKDSLFKDAITIREYRERVEDDTIVIDLYTKVQGYMKEYQVGYKTKPRTISLDTTLKIPVKYKPKLGTSVELGVPIEGIREDMTIKGNIFYDTKNILFSLGFDSKGTGWVGLGYKF